MNEECRAYIKEELINLFYEIMLHRIHFGYTRE